MFAEVHELCRKEERQRHEIASLESRLLTWFQYSAQPVLRLGSNRFVSSLDVAEVDACLTLLLAYLACLCLLYRIKGDGTRSKAMVIAASFIVGILRTLKQKQALRYLPAFVVHYSIYAKANLTHTLANSQVATSAAADLEELKGILNEWSRFRPEAAKALVDWPEKNSDDGWDSWPLSDLTTQERQMFSPPLQDPWCRVEV